MTTHLDRCRRGATAYADEEIAAHHTVLPDSDTPAVLITANPRSADANTIADRMLQHDECLRRLQPCPFVARRHGVFTHEQRLVIVAGYDGRPLPEVCDREGVPTDRWIEVALAVLHALDVAHRQGVLLVAPRPASFTIADDGTVRLWLLDTAVVQGRGAFAELRDDLDIAFAVAPELQGADPPSPAGDGYGTALLLLGAAIGRRRLEEAVPHVFAAPPAERRARIATLHQAVDRPFELALAAVPAALERFMPLLTAMLSRAPADRPPDGAAALARLRAAVLSRDDAPIARRAPPWPVPRSQHRHALIGAIAAAIVIAVVALGWRATRPASTRPTAAERRTPGRPAAAAARGPRSVATAVVALSRAGRMAEARSLLERRVLELPAGEAAAVVNELRGRAGDITAGDRAAYDAMLDGARAAQGGAR